MAHFLSVRVLQLILLLFLFTAVIEAQDFRSEKDRYEYALNILYRQDSGPAVRENLQTALKNLEICYKEQIAWGKDKKAAAIRAFHAGIASWYLGNRQKALYWFEQSFNLYPFEGEALYNRMILFYELNENSLFLKEKARFEKFLQKNSNPER